jgi:glucosamine kinase
VNALPRLILAVDTGGTKCDALLARDDGMALGFGRCDHRRTVGGNHRGGRGRSEEAIRAAVRDALATAPPCTELLCTTAMPIPADLLKALGHPRVVPAGWSEWQAALAQAGEACGVVTLSGTGALVVGLTPDGRAQHFDGLGPLLGDYGSGFYIGHLAAKAAARAPWGPRHHTSLAAAIPEALAAHTPDPSAFDLVGFMLSNPDRSEVASLATVVDREAEAGDAVARAILHEAADSMSETVRDLVEALSIAGEPLPMVGTGSVATRCRIFWERLCERVGGFAPNLRPVRLDGPAVLGVALCVLLGLDSANREQCRYNLFRTFDELP